jgi:hypothetical protein
LRNPQEIADRTRLDDPMVIFQMLSKKPSRIAFTARIHPEDKSLSEPSPGSFAALCITL